jgi:2-amino-4-hydroxy-6-hydroxymethyldihydropteridine diphosphokinase
VEAALGRERGSVWKSRTIDLEVLFFGMEQREDAHLTLPHPRIAERDFVAQPLMDIAPDLEVEGRGIGALVAALPEFELELYAAQLEIQSANQ